MPGASHPRVFQPANAHLASQNVPWQTPSSFIHIRGSHSFSNEPNFFKNEKVVREKGSQWGVLAHGGVTPLFDVASMENEN